MAFPRAGIDPERPGGGECHWRSRGTANGSHQSDLMYRRHRGSASPSPASQCLRQCYPAISSSFQRGVRHGGTEECRRAELLIAFCDSLENAF